jgi:branched-chain amino acid transport system substrate-binding protein
VDYAPDTKDFTKTIDDVSAFKPHIVLYMGTTEAVTDVLPGIEAKVGTPKPYYVFSDGGKIQELLDAVQADATLRPRVIGTAPGRTTPQYQQFRSRFKAFFNNEEPGAYAGQAYDSAYLTAYALVASSENAPTGAGVNDGLKRTVGGTKIGADPFQVNTAFAALMLEGGAIDYDGVSGPLDFDVDKGEAPADIDVWCIDSTGQFVSSGQYYDSVTRKVVGAQSNCN